jgi:esterase/lipase superfamily enzyme
MLGTMKRAALLPCVLFVLGGCTFSDSLHPEDIRSAWSLTAPAQRDTFFVTDREPDASALGYGLHWDADSHCGVARVTVPAAGGDAADAARPQPIACGAAMEGLASAVAKAAGGCNRVLVVVHGYNTVFRTGLLRAGQIATDTGWHCATLLLGWSSEGKFDRYVADIERSGFAVPVLATVLRALRAKGLETNVFASSMGTRIALGAATSLCMESPARIAGEMVLAAPDVGAEKGNDDFGHFLARSGGCVGRFTVYASDNDMALIASEAAHGGVPRAGAVPKQDRQYTGNVDVVDTDQAPGDPYGHGYYALSYELMHDAMLVLAGTPIQQRAQAATVTCLTPCVPGRGPYALVVAPDRRPDWTASVMRRLWPFIPSVR